MNRTSLALTGLVLFALGLPTLAGQGFRARGMPGRPVPLPSPPPPPAPRPAAARAPAPAPAPRPAPRPAPYRRGWYPYPYVRYVQPNPYFYSPYLMQPGYAYNYPMPGATVAVTTPFDPVAAPGVAPLAAREIPLMSGPIAVPPPGSAILRVRVANFQTRILFEGVDTGTTGTLRTFVTPSLSATGGQTYTVTAASLRNGQPVFDRRVVTVQPGQVQMVDFTQPGGW